MEQVQLPVNTPQSGPYMALHLELPNLWGNDGPCLVSPAVGPGSSHNPVRTDGDDDLLHQPLAVHQPPVLLQLMMLCQPQEVPILRIVERKSPGGPMPWGGWGQTRMSPATSHWGGATQEQTNSPSSTRWRYQVTFAEGRVPLLRGCPHDTSAEMAYQLCQPMWQTKATPQKVANWSRLREEDQAILVEEDVDLKSPPPLELHLQQHLGEEEPSPAGA